MDRFVPGRRAAFSGPLDSYRQPLSEQILRTYVDLLSSPGELVVSPFAQSEDLARVASAMGRRSVSAHANPLLMLLARARAAPAAAGAIDALYQQVADAPQHAVTTRQHILDLYRSRCPECGWTLFADYFVWGREQNQPLLKGFTCPSCAAAGEREVDELDIALAAGYQPKALSYWRVLNRLADRDEATYARAQSLLDLYTGRNLYALHHLTTRVEGIRLEIRPDTTEDTRVAILLDCLDRGASLDSPTRSRRLARLGPPARFVEHNVWRLFERACKAARDWARWPAIPYAELHSSLERTIIAVSNAAALSRVLPDGEVDLIISAPPSPWPAFWTLSYMWSAWLLGKAQAATLSPWLRRHSADWNWYVEVMSLTLSSLGRLLTSEGHLVLAWQCEQARWIEAVLVAAGQAQLQLAGLTCQPATEDDAPDAVEYRVVLVRRTGRASSAMAVRNDAGALERHIQRVGREASLAVLEARAEPTPGAQIHAGVYRRLIDEDLLGPGTVIRQQASVLQFVENMVWKDTRSEGGIWPVDARNVESPAGVAAHPGLSPELWWNEEIAGNKRALLDRLEMYVIELLTSTSPIASADLYEAIYARFEGMLTPDHEAISACLTSYARQDEEGRWHLRTEDAPAGRQAEMEYMCQCVKQLGERLGLHVHTQRFGDYMLGDCDTIWEFDGGQFYLLRVSGDTLTENLSVSPALAGSAPQCLMVLPGGRSSLVMFRQRASPLWRKTVQQHDWRFVKYRHLRRLMREESIDRSSLLAIVGLDPIVEQMGAQMPLL